MFEKFISIESMSILEVREKLKKFHKLTNKRTLSHHQYPTKSQNIATTVDSICNTTDNENKKMHNYDLSHDSLTQLQFQIDQNTIQDHQKNGINDIKCDKVEPTSTEYNMDNSHQSQKGGSFQEHFTSVSSIRESYKFRRKRELEKSSSRIFNGRSHKEEARTFHDNIQEANELNTFTGSSRSSLLTACPTAKVSRKNKNIKLI